jgi:hypothetical protein
MLSLIIPVSAGQSVYGPRDFSIPAGVRLLVVLLVVVWPAVSDLPIYDGFLDVYLFCMLHVLCVPMPLAVAVFIC